MLTQEKGVKATEQVSQEMLLGNVDVPDEVVSRWIAQAGLNSVLAIRGVCREMKNLVDSQHLWFSICVLQGIVGCDATFDERLDWKLLYVACEKPGLTLILSVCKIIIEMVCSCS